MPHDHMISPMVTVPIRTRGDIDLSEYRRTLGTFATGITIVTTRDSEDRPVGITVNSFNSVSLDPPLILWSLAKAARSFPVFDDNPLWAVHILSAHQEQLSRSFATCGAQKFAGVDLQTGLENLPLLRDCCARLQCKTVFKCEAGDHLILIGEVLAFDRCNLPPLVFQAGRYSFLPRMEAADTCSAAAS